MCRTWTTIWVPIFLLWSGSVFAQDVAVDTTAEDSVDVVLNGAIIQHLDSMTNCLFEGCFRYTDSVFMAEKFAFDTSNVPTYSDSEIIEKMRYIPAEIQLAYNPYVKAYINLYGYQRREQVRQMIGMSELYFPIFEAELDRRGMPMELKYLPVVESALNPHAVSRVGATGLWQIMYSTGKWLGMDIHSYIDERRDPYRSTEAALDYLQKMYEVYGDWLVVIAAYNCGPGNVNKAIRRSGGQTDFWSIRRYLPRETRGYVPAFIGATYVFHYFEDFHLQPIAANFSFNNTDTVMVYDKVSLGRIAEIIDADVNEINYLNPSLKKLWIPNSKDGYPLVLPIGKVYAFETMRDSIFNPTVAPIDIAVDMPNVLEQPQMSSMKRLTYTVKSGDNLGYIAEWYNCSAQQIRNWNNIYGNTIVVGDKLSIYVPEDVADKYERIDGMSFLEKQGKSTASSGSGIKYVPNNSNMTVLNYTVKSGDNLGFIAEWYDCSAMDIRGWNNIRGNLINVGDKLNIYVSSSKVDRYKNIDGMSFADKQAIEKGQSLTGQGNRAETNTEENCNCVYYEVKPGDTLWDIAKKYPGVSMDEIRQSNNISDTRGLKPGMKLKIRI